MRRHSTGADRISALPDELLSDIISRLRTKDAIRTTVLSSRWRGLWAATPLRLDEPSLMPAGRTLWNADPAAIAAASSQVVAAHPGPISTAYLFCDIMDAHGVGAPLADRIGAVAAKKAREVILFDSSQFLGGHRSPQAPVKNIGRVLTFSRALEKLALLMAFFLPARIRLRSRSLRCLVTFFSYPKELTLARAPRLERLFLANSWVTAPWEWGFRTRVKIRSAPRLRFVGYLNPTVHQLKIGNTVIKPGVGEQLGPNAMLPSVKTLGLLLWLGSEKEAKMVSSFLRCFPNLETLYIMSAKLSDEDEDAAQFSADFWHELGSIECVQFHINKLVFEGFRGEPRELLFLGCFTESAQMLHTVDIIFYEGGNYPVIDDDPLRALSFESVAGKTRAAFLRRRRLLSNQNVSDLSRIDPFDCIR